jgi:hypothetical protein
LKGFKDALARTRAERRRRRIHHNKFSERNNSVISMLEEPTVIIEKAFFEFIFGTRQPFQVAESRQFRTLPKLLKTPDVVCKMSSNTLERKICDIDIS